MPANSTNVKDEWFHGAASRAQVEGLVKKAGVNGSFAIRTSESVVGAYTISLLNKGKVFTYRVLPTEGKYAIQTGAGVQKKKFISIDGLVQEYKKPGNGLTCGLTNPVGQEKPALPNRNPNVSRALPPIPPYASTASSAPSAATLALPPKPVTPYVRASYTGPSPNTNAFPPKPVKPYVRASYIGPSPNNALPPKPVKPYVRGSYTGPSPNTNFNPAGILAAVTGRMPSTLPPRRPNTYESIAESATPAMTAPVPVIRLQPDSPAPQNPAGILAAVTGRMPTLPSTLPPRHSSIYESVAESATPAMTPPVPVIKLQLDSLAPQNLAGILAAVTGRMPTLPSTLPPQHSSIYESFAESATPGMTSPVPVIILQPDSPAPQNPAPTSAVESATMETSNSCIICYDAKFSAFFQPCGHVCCCMECSKKLKECPLCRKKITKMQRAFVS